MRRRPLLRAGMLAGTAYAAHQAGERSAQRQYAEGEQDQRLGELESQAPPAAPAADLWDVADAIPPGSAAAIALLEHTWAIPLRDAIVRAGGKPLADAWLAPEDVASIGLVNS